jgi:hypothetical protein
MKPAFTGFCSVVAIAFLPVAANPASSTPDEMGGNVLQFDQAVEQPD